MEKDPTSTTCVSCEIVGTYTDLASQFAEKLGTVMFDPMLSIFLGLCGIWIVWQGIQFLWGRPDYGAFAKQFFFMILAASLLGGQGPDMMLLIYHASLKTMSGAASAVLSVAQQGFLDQGQSVAGLEHYEGMSRLVFVAEQGVMKVFSMAWELFSSTTLTDWGPALQALLLLPPWFLLIVVYFAQVGVSIFRVMVVATFAPYLMLALGFGWGRDICMKGVNTLITAFMVLFGSTVAIAVCLYGVSVMHIAEQGFNVRSIDGITDATLLVPIMLGWLGTAFMAEATSIANSITNAALTNQAAAIITAGATATGVAALTQAKGQWGDAAGQAGEKILSGVGHGAGYAAGATGSGLGAGAQAVKDRLDRTRGGEL